MLEFKPFAKIRRIDDRTVDLSQARLMQITKKLDGTNACIHVHKDGNLTSLFAGSRNRYITVEDDNFGFASWVLANLGTLYDELEEGYHYGEWCGPGINNGEGLEQRELFFFDKSTPHVAQVPVLVDWCKFDVARIQAVYLELERLDPHAEGIVINVINFDGSLHRYKMTYRREDVKKVKLNNIKCDINSTPYLQPDRLAKLLGRDEKYIRDYPKSLVCIVKDYLDDLVSESESVIPVKSISRAVFVFVKNYMGESHAK